MMAAEQTAVTYSWWMTTMQLQQLKTDGLNALLKIPAYETCNDIQSCFIIHDKYSTVAKALPIKKKMTSYVQSVKSQFPNK